jgi:putative ABC transport system permease protein
MNTLLQRLLNLLRRSRHDADLREEIETHRSLRQEALERDGLTPDQAADASRRALGNVTLAVEDARDVWAVRVLDNLGQDLRAAVRGLRKSVGFSAVVIGTLALGIGANTALFQLLDAVRLRDLPVHAPAQLRLVRIAGNGPSGNFTARYSDLSSAQWQQLEARQQAFSTIAAWSPRQFNLADGGVVRRAEGMFVSGAFFELLGVSAARGRVLAPADDRPGCGSPLAVVSDAFWRRELRKDPGVIGAPLRIDGHVFTIAGITPASFFGVEVGRSYDIAVPLCAESLMAGSGSQFAVHRDNYWLSAIGRLREGWAVAQADAQLRAISPQIFTTSLPADASAEDAQRYTAMWLHSVPAAKGLSWLRVEYERSLWLLLISAGLVLLIVCGNLANLLLARGGARADEITVRLALGASRGRVIRQLLTESVVIASAGAALGLALAGGVNTGLVSMLVTVNDPVALPVGMDWRAAAFSFAVAMATCATFGLVPALRTAKTMRPGGRGVVSNPGRSVLARALVVAQVALGFVLVAGALLFGRSLHNLLTVNLGFQPEPVMIASVDTRRLGFNEDRRKELYRVLLDQMRAAPGVLGVAQSNIVPMSGWESNTTLIMDDGRSVATRTSSVSSGYFEALGVSLLAGRDFDSRDGENAETVAVVNDAFVRKFLSGTDPIGATFRVDNDRTARIVGLVGNTKYRTLREPFQPTIFFSTTQMDSASAYARFVVRSARPWAETGEALRASIASVSPSIDVELVPLATQIRQSVVRDRLIAAVGGGFGVLAGVLAALGVYGLLSYSVEVRRQEIGIRMALGADRAGITGLVVHEAKGLVMIGAAAGLVMTLIAGRAATGLLYGLRPGDPLTLVATLVVLSAIGLTSAYVPARRAAAIDPCSAIRRG